MVRNQSRKRLAIRPTSYRETSCPGMTQSVQDIVIKCVSEFILQTMLAREDQTAREFAVQLILKLREYSIYEDSSVRARIIPVIDTAI